MANLALLVGIDDYPNSPLAGCVNDATRMYDLLRKHYDESPNFESIKLVAPSAKVTRAKLRRAAGDLFAKKVDVALFFFAAHGTVNNLGGFLVTQDAAKYDEGLRMGDVANNSPARERIMIPDCCHSGALGSVPACPCRPQ